MTTALNISDPAVIVSALQTFDRHGTLGALEIGVLVSVLLLGITAVQAYHYYCKFPEDPWPIKSLVFVVCLCEIGQAISVSHTLYKLTISDYGNPFSLENPPKSLSLSIIFSGVIGPLVQVFFANRIRIVSHRWFVPIACWVLSFLRFVGSLVTGVEGLKMKDLQHFESQWAWLVTTVLAVGAAVDVLIATSLSYYLMAQRPVAYKTTVQVIDKLIAWTIETCLLTSVTGIIMLICFLKMKNNFVWLLFFMIIGRLFSNSLLATLNARETLRLMKNEVVEFSSVPATFSSPKAITDSTEISLEMTKQVAGDERFDRLDKYEPESPV